MDSKLPPLWRDLSDLKRRSVAWLCLEAILTGLLAGLVIGLFRLVFSLVGHTLTFFKTTYFHADVISCIILAICLLFAVGISILFLKLEPLVSGSGIPQVELVVRGLLPPMHFMRVLICKFFATLVSLASGLALGREGPCIQMGAMAGQSALAILHPKSKQIRARFLIAGSVAGMTAAFSAPLAGLLFAFEEMRTILAPAMILFCAIAAASAFFVVQVIFGFGLVFPFEQCVALALDQYWIAIIVGLTAGLLSVLYNHLLIGLTLALDRLHLSLFLRVALPFVIAFFCFLFYPYVLTNFGVAVLDLETMHVTLLWLLCLLVLKILFAVLSFSSTVSGGLLMPMLAIGALLGAVIANILLNTSLIVQQQQSVIIILAMAGLFAGTVRAPLTGSFLLLEMTGAYSCIVTVLISAFIAVLVCNLCHVEPVYDSLKRRILALAKPQ